VLELLKLCVSLALLDVDGAHGRSGAVVDGAHGRSGAVVDGAHGRSGAVVDGARPLESDTHQADDQQEWGDHRLQ